MAALASLGLTMRDADRISYTSSLHAMLRIHTCAARATTRRTPTDRQQRRAARLQADDPSAERRARVRRAVEAPLERLLVGDLLGRAGPPPGDVPQERRRFAVALQTQPAGDDALLRHARREGVERPRGGRLPLRRRAQADLRRGLQGQEPRLYGYPLLL